MPTLDELREWLRGKRVQGLPKWGKNTSPLADSWYWIFMDDTRDPIPISRWDIVEEGSAPNNVDVVILEIDDEEIKKSPLAAIQLERLWEVTAHKGVRERIQIHGGIKHVTAFNACLEHIEDGVLVERIEFYGLKAWERAHGISAWRYALAFQKAVREIIDEARKMQLAEAPQFHQRKAVELEASESEHCPICKAQLRHCPHCVRENYCVGCKICWEIKIR